MTHSRQWRVVLGIGAAMLLLLLSACPFVNRNGRQPPLAARGPKGRGAEQVGKASWYGPGLNGKKTASGETFDQTKLTAASKTLPLGSRVVVTNMANGKSVEVKINDRGPYVKGRKIDLSRAAAQRIGMTKKGLTKVKIRATIRRKPPRHRAVRRAKRSTRRRHHRHGGWQTRP
jgi:rare lipoprotein A